MIPDAAAMPAIIISERTPPRLAYVRDPAGRSALNGYGTLTERRRWGATVTGYTVAFANGVTADVPPAWVSFPNGEQAAPGLVIPLPPRGVAA